MKSLDDKSNVFDIYMNEKKRRIKMTILDGKALSKALKDKLKNHIAALVAQTSIVPGLAIVLVGEDPASQIYVRNKIKAANYCGISAKRIDFPTTITEKELIECIQQLNQDDTIHGIIVQLPLPSHINEQHIIDTIAYIKDVDGFGIQNKGRLFSGLPAIESATPRGIMRLLEAYDIDVSGKNACVVGRSNIVGKPMAMLLLNRNATVTICHSKTQNLKEITKNADILIVAIGKNRFITEDMVKENAVVIDVGTNRVGEKLYGDVDFEQVKEKCAYITPVPGGVGPLTIASLLENTVLAYQNILKTKSGENI